MVKPYSPRLSLMELFLQAGWELSPEFQHSRALAKPIAREARDLMPPHPRTLELNQEEERVGKKVSRKPDSSLVLNLCKSSKRSLWDTIVEDDCATKVSLMSQIREEVKLSFCKR